MYIGIKHRANIYAFDLISRILKAARHTCVDWLNGTEPPEFRAQKGKKGQDRAIPVDVPRKNVSPSTTQVNLVT